jgi:dTDP-glucose pyrophosphorylase
MAQAVILAAGKSSRYGQENKITKKFEGRILTSYLLDFCIENNVDDVVIVISKDDIKIHNINDKMSDVEHGVIEAINHDKMLSDINVTYVFQNPNRPGPAGGLMAAKEFITDDFFVFFGDNFLKGKIEFTITQAKADCVIGSLYKEESEDNLRLGSIWQSDDYIELIEKPHTHTRGYYFIGFAYFKLRTLENIHLLTLSVRGEFEITEFINRAYSKELYDVSKLKWIDITYPEEYDTVASYIKKSNS